MGHRHRFLLIVVLCLIAPVAAHLLTRSPAKPATSGNLPCACSGPSDSALTLRKPSAFAPAEVPSEPLAAWPAEESPLDAEPAMPHDTPPAEDVSEAILRGSILGAHDESPIPDVDVFARIKSSRGTEIRQTRTASDGTFEFVNLTVGEFISVSPRAAGYVCPLNHDTPEHFFATASNPRNTFKPEDYRDFPIRPTRVSNSKVTLQSLKLRGGLNELLFKIERGIFASGLVTDESGMPVPDAAVELRGDGMDYGLINVSSVDGSFKVGPLVARSASLDFKVRAAGFETHAGEVPCRGIDLTDLRFTLKRAASIKGRFIPLGDAPKGKLKAEITNGQGYSRSVEIRADEGYEFRFDDIPTPGNVSVRVLIDRSSPNLSRVYNILAVVEAMNSVALPTFVELRQPQSMTLVVELPAMPENMSDERSMVCIIGAGSVSGDMDWPHFDETEQRGFLAPEVREVSCSTVLQRFRAVVRQTWNPPKGSTTSAYFISDLIENRPGETLRVTVKPLEKLAGRIRGEVPGKSGGHVVIAAEEGQVLVVKVNAESDFDTGHAPALLPGAYYIWWQEDARVDATRKASAQRLDLQQGATLKVTVAP